MMNLFTSVFASLPRQGPGSDACTYQALALLKAFLPAAPAILDIGCGSGAQTLCLAEALPLAHITALDAEPLLLTKLTREVTQRGLSDRVKSLTGHMEALPFASASFDLIWSEGAIYIIGLEAGLTAWGPLLKPGGCLGISQLCWLTETPSAAARSFWEAAYPQICHHRQLNQTIRQLGYHIRGEFTLPQQAWWQDYYSPLEQVLQQLPATPAATELKNGCQAEIELFRQYGNDYGYRFWVLQKS